MGPEQKKDRNEDGDDWEASLPKIQDGDGAESMPSQQSELSEAEIAADEQWLRQIRDATGLSKRVFKDESLAPAVDMELVRAYARDELGPEEAERVLQLNIDFKSWHDAVTEVYGEAAREQIRKNRKIEESN